MTNEDLDKLQAICDAAQVLFDATGEFNDPILVAIARTAMPQLIARVRELEADKACRYKAQSDCQILLFREEQANQAARKRIAELEDELATKAAKEIE